MLNDRLPAARKVAGHLFDLESSMDDAIMKAAAMLVALPEARINARLSATVGQHAMEGAAATLSSLIQARRNMVEMHDRLGQLQEDIGLRQYAMGDLWKLVPPKAAGPQLVQDVAA